LDVVTPDLPVVAGLPEVVTPDLPVVAGLPEVVTPVPLVVAGLPGVVTPDLPVVAGLPGVVTPDLPVVAGLPGVVTPELPVIAGLPGVVTRLLGLGVALADTQGMGASLTGNLGNSGTARVTCCGTVGSPPTSGAVWTMDGGKTANGSILTAEGAVVVDGAAGIAVEGLPKRRNRSSELVD
jgi:hypothetical protein